MKTCPKCKTEYLDHDANFHKATLNVDGLAFICKKCKKETDKRYRKTSVKYKEYQKSPEFIFSQLKYQAKKRNMPFEIDEVYYHKELAHKPCHYCGNTDTKYWVDRYINDHSIGYTKENTVPCCELCNKMKISLSPEVFIEHAKRIYKFNK